MPNNLRLEILRNKEILGKFQNCVAYLVQKHFLALTLKNYAKADIKVFLSCVTLFEFLFFLKYFLNVSQDLRMVILENIISEKMHEAEPISYKFASFFSLFQQERTLSQSISILQCIRIISCVRTKTYLVTYILGD